MTDDAIPSLNLAISSLATSNNFARWVTKAPLPGGYVHHDCEWTESLTTEWMAWQEMFCLQKMPTLPMLEQLEANSRPKLTLSGEGGSYGGQLMQKLGISLWQWLFQASIGQSFAQSQGIALGKNQPLRIRLECRNPYLILLPWEIMQQAGKQAISLHPNILFSRTTSDVEPLPPIKPTNSLNILLVIGEKQIKRVRVVRRADGYYCQFLIDVERQEYHKPTGQITGIDLGLKEFYTDAQGNTVENPRYLRKND